MEKKLKIGQKVINPDVSSQSPNFIGLVIEINTYFVHDKFINIAWVKFRDYEGGFSFNILRKFKD